MRSNWTEMLQRAMERKRAAGVKQNQQEIEGYLAPGRDALATTFQAVQSDAMPEFQHQLQGLRESAQRRGIANGETATNYEGDLASAFQRNISNALARQSTDLYGLALDQQAGDRDRRTAEKNARRQSRSGLWGTLGSIGGTILGGPVGGALATAIGKRF